jgi:hypothetical protein
LNFETGFRERNHDAARHRPFAGIGNQNGFLRGWANLDFSTSPVSAGRWQAQIFSQT